MDDLKKIYVKVQAGLQDLEHAQSALTRQIKASARETEARSRDVEQAMAELRGAFTGIAATQGVEWNMLQDHERRLKALESREAS